MKTFTNIQGIEMKTVMLIMLSTIALCIADQRHFVWTYEYKTVSRGEAEFEHYYTTSYPNSSDLSDGTKVGHQLELEIGMNERYDFAIYHQFEQMDNNFTYKGYKLRGRYRLGEQNQYFMDPLLYLEYHGKPDFSEHGIETKLILAKETERLIVSFNPVMEIEVKEQEIETEYAAGLTYKLNKLFHAGIEFKGSEYGHYWGPTISHGTHDIWLSLGSAFALGTIKEGKPEMEIRMIMGVGLK